MKKIERIMIVGFLSVALFSCQTNEEVKKEDSDNKKSEKPKEEVETIESQIELNLKLQGVEFNVKSISKEGQNEIEIRPTGLEHADEVYTHKTMGEDISAEAEDLDSDGSPELVVFARSNEVEVEVFAYSTYDKKSMGMINFKNELPEGISGELVKMEFSLVETYLSRRLTYKKAEGQELIIQTEFKLVNGEAMKQLVMHQESKMEM